MAYRPMALRMASRPCSGRTLALSHLGPPTAPSRTASDARQAAFVSSGRASPVASMAAPPIRCWLNSKRWP
ncbi:hypothetical protein D3C71_1968710 [compost metagenome]